MSITPGAYTLSSESQLTWTVTQKKGLSLDYPFVDIHHETAEQYVQRTYLQFLWLPESIMPVNLLVPSMQRVSVASSSSWPSTSTSQPDPPSAHPHPLHELLDQVLLSVRASSNKYHVELPQILADGVGEGEAEEMMMWYALNHEKGAGADDRPRAKDADGPWLDDAWRKTWLDRLERREVRIQILLYFLKLSLPGPQPRDPAEHDASPAAKRKRWKPKAKIVTLTVQERLESFMDKMATWQMLGSFDVHTADHRQSGKKDERDWMQVFCEDVVETLFRQKLPQLCDLFRTKVFPDSPFSDGNSSDTQPRSDSPTQIDDTDDTADSAARPSLHRERSGSILSNQSRYPSPALSTASASHKPGAATSLARSRSRSLSVSLAQDASSRRAGSAGVAKKPALNREVSMSRVFKDKPARKEDAKKAKAARTLSGAASKPAKGPADRDSGVTLVASTPVKKVKTQQLLSFGVPNAGKGPRSPTPGGMRGDEEEEDWSVFSSPDVILLGAGDEIDNGSSSIGQVLANDTPVKGGRSMRYRL